MILRKPWAICIAGLLYAVSNPAWAAGDYYIGPEAGLGLLNAGAGSHINWGLSAGARVLPHVFVGAYYNAIPFGSVSSPSGVSVSGSENFYGVESRFDFTPLVSGFSAGLRTGFSKFSTQAVVPGQAEDDESHSGFTWGPIVAYDRPLTSVITLGGELYFMVPSETGANNVLGMLATLRWWF